MFSAFFDFLCRARRIAYAALQISVPIICMSQMAFARSEPDADKSNMCEKTLQEHGKIATPRLRRLLNQKPQDVVTGLDSEQLRKLQRLIELNERLMFKCRYAVHPDLARSGAKAKKKLYSHIITIPDLPTRKPEFAFAKTSQVKLLPLPVRKPK